MNRETYRLDKSAPAAANTKLVELKAVCSLRDLVVKDNGNGHWQILGGPRIVNYYPFAKRGPTVYVCGERGGRPAPRDAQQISDLVFA